MPFPKKLVKHILCVLILIMGTTPFYSLKVSAAGGYPTEIPKDHFKNNDRWTNDPSIEELIYESFIYNEELPSSYAMVVYQYGYDKTLDNGTPSYSISVDIFDTSTTKSLNIIKDPTNPINTRYTTDKSDIKFIRYYTTYRFYQDSSSNQPNWHIYTQRFDTQYPLYGMSSDVPVSLRFYSSKDTTINFEKSEVDSDKVPGNDPDNWDIEKNSAFYVKPKSNSINLKTTNTNDVSFTINGKVGIIGPVGTMQDVSVWTSIFSTAVSNSLQVKMNNNIVSDIKSVVTVKGTPTSWRSDKYINFSVDFKINRSQFTSGNYDIVTDFSFLNTFDSLGLHTGGRQHFTVSKNFDVTVYRDDNGDGKDDDTGEDVPDSGFDDTTFDIPDFPKPPDSINPIDWIKWLLEVLFWLWRAILAIITGSIKYVVNGIQSLISPFREISNFGDSLFSFIPKELRNLVFTSLGVTLIISLWRFFKR